MISAKRNKEGGNRMELLEELQTNGIMIDDVYFRREESFMVFKPYKNNSIRLYVGKHEETFLQAEPIENCNDGMALWIADNTGSKVVHKIKTIISEGSIEICDITLLTKELLQSIADRINGKSDLKLPQGIKFDYTVKVL